MSCCGGEITKSKVKIILTEMLGERDNEDEFRDFEQGDNNFISRRISKRFFYKVIVISTSYMLIMTETSVGTLMKFKNKKDS